MLLLVLLLLLLLLLLLRTVKHLKHLVRDNNGNESTSKSKSKDVDRNEDEDENDDDDDDDDNGKEEDEDESKDTEKQKMTGRKSEGGHKVYGFLYNLSPSDEIRLDRMEGVPYSYEKKMMDIVVVPTLSSSSSPSGQLDIGVVSHNYVMNERGRSGSGSGSGSEGGSTRVVRALVYINEEDVREGISKDEYTDRINCGIRDAVRLGVPGEYIRELKRFIPEKLEEGMVGLVDDPYLSMVDGL